MKNNPEMKYLSIIISQWDDHSERCVHTFTCRVRTITFRECWALDFGIQNKGNVSDKTILNWERKREREREREGELTRHI